MSYDASCRSANAQQESVTSCVYARFIQSLFILDPALRMFLIDMLVASIITAGLLFEVVASEVWIVLAEESTLFLLLHISDQLNTGPGAGRLLRDKFP